MHRKAICLAFNLGSYVYVFSYVELAISLLSWVKNDYKVTFEYVRISIHSNQTRNDLIIFIIKLISIYMNTGFGMTWGSLGVDHSAGTCVAHSQIFT